TKQKRELIVIMTPHIVRSRQEGERILADESRRVDWVLSDVLKVHGTSGMEPVLPPLAAGGHVQLPPGPPPSVPQLPGLGETPHETLPPPQILPPGQTKGQSPALGVGTGPSAAMSPGAPGTSGSSISLPPAVDAGRVPADQGKES